MAIILEMDVGNSRLKWRIFNDDPLSVIIEKSYTFKPSWIEKLAQNLKKYQNDIRLVRASVVNNLETRNQLSTLINDVLGVPIFFAQVVKCCAGVTVAYQEPSRLGVDRWLAMLAAHNRFSEKIKIIIDSGTALTIDVVDNNGFHLGGYILPGLEMMESALQNGTSITLNTHQKREFKLGCSTFECVNNGLFVMQCALIDKVVSQFKGSVVLFTGGAIKPVYDYLNYKNGHFLKNLVLDGLSITYTIHMKKNP